MKTIDKRTNFLKECIADSLLRLLETKDFESITITEITKLANVGRATYYRYFPTKEAVIVFKLQYMLEEWENQLPEPLRKKQPPTMEGAVAFMTFFYVNDQLFKQLYQNRLLHLLLEAFYGFFEKSIEPEEELSPFIQAFHIFGMFGMIREWVRTGMEVTPEEITIIMFKDALQREELLTKRRPRSTNCL